MNNTPLEKEIEKKIGDWAKKKDCSYSKFTSPAQRAVPDRLIVTRSGVHGYLEVKRFGCKPTPLQYKKMQELIERRCNVAWVDNVLDGQHFINMLHCTGAPFVMGDGLKKEFDL